MTPDGKIEYINVFYNLYLIYNKNHNYLHKTPRQSETCQEFNILHTQLCGVP